MLLHLSLKTFLQAMIRRKNNRKKIKKIHQKIRSETIVQRTTKISANLAIITSVNAINVTIILVAILSKLWNVKSIVMLHLINLIMRKQSRNKAVTINAKIVATIKIVTKEIHKINAVTIAKMPLKIRKISTENNLNKILQPENQKVEMQLKSVIHVIITNVTINAIMIVAIVRT